METEKLLVEIRAAIREAMKELSGGNAEERMPAALTLKRAAAELSVSVSTIKGLVKRSAIQTCTVGKRRLIPASEIARLSRPAEIKQPSKRRKNRFEGLDESQKVKEMMKAVRKRRT